MTLRTTHLGLDLIKAFEGLRLSAYKCPAGVWTIGYGTTSATGRKIIPGLKITQDQAEAWFRADIDQFENDVERALGDSAKSLTSPQFDALVSLAYNIGLGAFRQSTLLKKIKAGDLDAVPAQIMRWNKVNGQAVTGLTRRRRAEAALWRGDIADAERYESMTFGAMPQAVDTPRPKKPIVKSKTANASIVAGAGGLSVVTTALDAAQKAKDVSDGWIDMAGKLTGLPVFWIGLLIIAAAAFIWWERRRKLQEDGE